jgi:hypothetical protein
VEAEASLGVGVVGYFSAAVEVDGGVGLAGGYDRNAARGEQGAKANAEGEGELLLGLGPESAARIIAAVGGVEEDEKAGWLRSGRRLGCGSGRSLGWGSSGSFGSGLLSGG